MLFLCNKHAEILSNDTQMMIASLLTVYTRSGEEEMYSNGKIEFYSFSLYLLRTNALPGVMNIYHIVSHL